MKLASLFLLLAVLFSQSPLMADCSECPSSSENMERVILAFGEALGSKSQKILVVKKISQADAAKKLGVASIDFLSFRNELMQGKAIEFFEVVENITGDFKIVVYAAPAMRGPLHPDLGAVSFSPPESSKWLVVARPVRLIGDASDKVQLVDFSDLRDAVFAFKDENRLNVNMENFLSDLRSLRAVKISDHSSLPHLKTGLGEVILKQILRRGPSAIIDK